MKITWLPAPIIDGSHALGCISSCGKRRWRQSMPTGGDRQTVGEVWCREHRRGRHVRGARRCERIGSARGDREKLPFKCEIMICPARDIIKLTSKDPFARQPSGPDITRFVSVYGGAPTSLRRRRSSSQSAFGRRLAAEDHCDPGQIRPGSVSPADESDQLPRQDRETSGRAGHDAQLEHDRESRKNST